MREKNGEREENKKEEKGIVLISQILQRIRLGGHRRQKFLSKKTRRNQEKLRVGHEHRYL